MQLQSAKSANKTSTSKAVYIAKHALTAKGYALCAVSSATSLSSNELLTFIALLLDVEGKAAVLSLS